MERHHQGWPPPLIGFGKSVVEETPEGVPINQFAVISYLKADKILKSLTRSQFNEVYVTNNLGELIVHPDSQKMLNPDDKMVDPLVKEALEKKYRTSVIQYEQDGVEMLGAFSKALNSKVFIMSKVSGKKAFSVVDRLIFRSIAFALMLVTLAFIFAILFFAPL